MVEDFETRHVVLPKVPPHEMLQYLAEEHGMKHKHLAAIIPAATAKLLAAEFRVSTDLLL